MKALRKSAIAGSLYPGKSLMLKRRDIENILIQYRIQVSKVI